MGSVYSDARPTAGAAHYNELETRLSELPDGKVIIYCRGPDCVYADEILSILAAQGWKVARLEEGVVEWQLAEGQ